MANLHVWMGGQYLSINRLRKIPDEVVCDDLLHHIIDFLLSSVTEEIAGIEVKFTSGKKGRPVAAMPNATWYRILPSYQWDLFTNESWSSGRISYMYCWGNGLCSISQWTFSHDAALVHGSMNISELPTELPILNSLDSFLEKMGFPGDSGLPRKSLGQNLAKCFWKEKRSKYSWTPTVYRLTHEL